jgi:hypothetical protein
MKKAPSLTVRGIAGTPLVTFPSRAKTCGCNSSTERAAPNRAMLKARFYFHTRKLPVYRRSRRLAVEKWGEKCRFWTEKQLKNGRFLCISGLIW